MTTTEHLQLIKSECERLLAIAEKRIQGEWKSWKNPHPEDNGVGVSQKNNCHDVAHCDIFANWSLDQCDSNAAYIASCAGRAEAGWRSTIAAIDYAIHMRNADKRDTRAIWVIDQILAAWPIEFLQQTK